jgi:hypothetical protein
MTAAAKKANETATILRAGRTRAASHNKAAKPVATSAKKRERVMVNVPVEMVPEVKAHAEALGITMSTYFVMAAKEKLMTQ